MRYFIIETNGATGRKYFRGLSVREKYAADRRLSAMTARPGRTLSVEAFPSVAAAGFAIAEHNAPLPFRATGSAA